MTDDLPRRMFTNIPTLGCRDRIKTTSSLIKVTKRPFVLQRHPRNFLVLFLFDQNEISCKNNTYLQL